MSVDLKTKYLGLELKNPVVASASPLTQDLDQLRRLEEAGIAAAVLSSLFEEQIEHEAAELTRVHEFGAESFAEALTYFPQPQDYRTGPEEYLTTISQAKKAVSIPIIASLNGASKGGWVRYARMMQDAGADALELNIYFVAADIEMTGEDVEKQYLELVQAVRESVTIPLAVKLGPYFSSLGNMARRLVAAGADGLVLFNRFIQPDIDLEELQTATRLVLSRPEELLVPLRWIAILYGKVKASLAATGGIHDAAAMLKVLLAGADVGMVAALLYRQGTEGVRTMLAEMTRWMEEKEYASVSQLRGSMSRENCPDPSAFQRGNYMKALVCYTGRAI